MKFWAFALLFCFGTNCGVDAYAASMTAHGRFLVLQSQRRAKCKSLLDPNRLELVPLAEAEPPRRNLETPKRVLEYPHNSKDQIEFHKNIIKHQMANNSDFRVMDIVSKDGERILSVTHLWKTDAGEILERESADTTKIGKFTMNNLTDQPQKYLLDGALSYMKAEVNVSALDYFIVADNKIELVMYLRRRVSGEVDVIIESALASPGSANEIKQDPSPSAMDESKISDTLVGYLNNASLSARFDVKVSFSESSFLTDRGWRSTARTNIDRVLSNREIRQISLDPRVTRIRLNP